MGAFKKILRGTKPVEFTDGLGTMAEGGDSAHNGIGFLSQHLGSCLYPESGRPGGGPRLAGAGQAGFQGA